MRLADVKEDMVSPDDRGGAASVRQGQVPGDVILSGPAYRKIFLVADAVQFGSTPLGPVLSLEGGKGSEGQGQCKTDTIHMRRIPRFQFAYSTPMRKRPFEGAVAEGGRF